MTLVEDRTRHSPQADTERWLTAFEAALQSHDAAAAAALFLADGLWRDRASTEANSCFALGRT